jgi:hypothetical protein
LKMLALHITDEKTEEQRDFKSSPRSLRGMVTMVCQNLNPGGLTSTPCFVCLCGSTGI